MRRKTRYAIWIEVVATGEQNAGLYADASVGQRSRRMGIVIFQVMGAFAFLFGTDLYRRSNPNETLKASRRTAKPHKPRPFLVWPGLTGVHWNLLSRLDPL